MAVSKRLRTLYNNFFDGIETFVANKISDIQEKKYLRTYITKEPIPADFKRQIREFWKPWTKVSPQWAWYYASQNGIVDPKYIPNDLYYTKIDQHFNQRKLGWGFNDKNYYDRIFAGIKQPKTIIRNISGILLDDKYCQISIDDAILRICAFDEVICKPTLESGSGRGIEFWDTHSDRNSIRSFLTNKNENDYIVQQIIVQHPDLDLIHKGSINSIRIASILMPDGVHILSSNLRMGVDKSRIDNVTAGGISAGINSDGTLKKYATSYYSGEKYSVHPQGMVFNGFLVPSFDKALELVRVAAPLIPHFRLVSWDIAIDENGDALLIEANMRKGGINLCQFNNGPLFGDLTERVLNEVFNK